GSHVSTRFLRWLKQFFDVNLVGFRGGVRQAVCDSPLLKSVRFPICGPYCLEHRLRSVCDQKPRANRNLRELLACALGRHHKTNGTRTYQNFYRKGVYPCRTAEDVYDLNLCSQPKSLACPSTPILRT